MKFQEELQINATPQAIYDVYAEVDQWSQWDPGVADATAGNGLAVGSVGTLQPTKGPKSKIRITEATEAKSFTVTSRLPLCSLQFVHRLEPQSSGTLVTHEVVFDGALSPVFGRLLGSRISGDLPETLAGLKKKCEVAA